MFRAIVQRFPSVPKTLVRLGAVAGLAVAGLVIGKMAASLRRPELLLAAGGLPVAGLVALRHGRLEHGVLGIVLAAAVLRFTLPTGTQSRIVMSLVVTAGVLGLWIAKMVVRDKLIQLKPAPTNVPLLGFAFTCVISFVWSNAFRDLHVVTWKTWPFVQFGGLAVMVLLPAAFLLAAQCFHEMKWLIWLTVVILVVGTVAIASHFLHLHLNFLQVRPLFPTWFISLAYALALFDRRLHWALRLALLSLVGAWLYRVFVQQFSWLSAWIPSLTAIGAISTLRSRKLLLVLLAILCVILILNRDVLITRLEEERSESGDTRIDAWLHNWRVTSQHLLFGVGPAGYAVYYMTYFPMEAMATHSTYIDVLSQTGIMGLVFFIWFFIALFLAGWRLQKRTSGRRDFAEAFTMAAVGGYAGTIVAMALGDWIVPFVYTQTIAGFDYAVYTWVLLGAALSLYHILDKEEITEDTP